MVAEVRWTEAAAADLNDISDYLVERNPDAAAWIVARIYESAEALRRFPHRRRAGVASGTRDLVVASVGYIITYEVIGETVLIDRIHHGSQDWPNR